MEQSQIWSTYRTAKQRNDPTSSTPKSIRPAPETPPNVTSIERDRDENLAILSSHDIQLNPVDECKKLRVENEKLRKVIGEQQVTIQKLTSIIKQLNFSNSELDSSESQNEKSVSLSCSKNMKVQRVTPTKRSDESRSSSASVTPQAPPTPNNESSTRHNRSRLNGSSSTTTPFSTPRNGSGMRRTRDTPVVNSTRVLDPSTRHNLPPIQFQTPQYSSSSSTTLSGPVTSPRRERTRRQLFSSAREANLPTRSNSEPIIEHLAVSPIKDSAWSKALPPRVYLEMNRPAFIERLEARQDIIREAARRRSRLEICKRSAARNVISGQQTVEDAERYLNFDTTQIKAFSQREMKELTQRNIRKTQDYRNRVTTIIGKMDKDATRVITKVFNERTRSKSRGRYGRRN